MSRNKTGGKKKDFIKRLAGLEGDKVEIRETRPISKNKHFTLASILSSVSADSSE